MLQSVIMRNKALYVLSVLSLLGVADALYLTLKHYSNAPVPCSVGFFSNCGHVLESQYSITFGVPIALLGLLYYLSTTASLALIISYPKRIFKYFLILTTSFGFIFSLYLVFLQLVVINAICLYCMASALISTLLFIITQITFSKDRWRLWVFTSSYVYKKIIRQAIFAVFDAETIHNLLTNLGELLGSLINTTKIDKVCTKNKFPTLKQKVAGINFDNPIGLAAGFDYEAKLTQFLPYLGFGFETVGTVTNMAYEGNPKPRLGRLPKSKSLMVNKGFKSSGAKSVANYLMGKTYKFPVGISIGRTNSAKLKTQKQSINDIISAFNVLEAAKLNNSYYELNISCPNLIHGGNITFYTPKNLKELLVEVDKLKLKKPVFVKMPITESDEDTLKMLKVISKHSPVGVIFGNLQKDRKHKRFDQDEINSVKMGNFSGKPTYDRSNELISLTYKHYKKRFIIIGCGGVFNGADAYEKIKRGATLVQLITGLIFEGPELAAKINFELEDLLQKDGYKNVNEAVGTKYKS